ncbi:MAG: ribonuclease Z [Synergistaceae bacterium]|nr:ribonuclease Z [Synergistaceae bacterium]
MIDVTLIGTAALAPIPERALSSAFLTCEGHSILFDCGEGTQSAARRAGVSPMKTDIIALTHYHGDHIFGIPGLLQTMFSMGRTETLYFAGPSGLPEVMSLMLRLTGELSYDVGLVEIPPDGLRLCELVPGWPAEALLEAFPTKHRCASQGYSFTLGRAGKFNPSKAQELGVPLKLWRVLQRGESVFFDGTEIKPEQVLGERRKGLKVVFTGDTAMCKSLVNASKGADLMICDATYGDEAQAELALERGHMNFSQAAQSALLSGVKTLWLTHYSQSVTRPSVFLPKAQEIFPNTFCGHDGMSITLKFSEES